MISGRADPVYRKWRGRLPFSRAWWVFADCKAEIAYNYSIYVHAFLKDEYISDVSIGMYTYQQVEKHSRRSDSVGLEEGKLMAHE